jgi:hypothetical protein
MSFNFKCDYVDTGLFTVTLSFQRFSTNASPKTTASTIILKMPVFTTEIVTKRRIIFVIENSIFENALA